MDKQLVQYVETLKQAGFTVFTNTKDCNYINFSKDNQVGYCQFDGYFSFSTCHKANSVIGTGFSVHQNVVNPTVQHALDTFAMAPEWAGNTYWKHIKKYKDIAEYMTKHLPLTYRQM